MTPRQVVNYLEKKRLSRRAFADRLNITEQAIAFWLQQGWIPFDRQCHIEIELKRKLRASWADVPQERRPNSDRDSRLAKGS